MNAQAAPNLPIQGYVHSVEVGSSVDGPGMRVTVFLTGCPLNCQYCHNPDTRKMKNGKQRSVDDVLAEIERYKPFLRMNKGGVTVSGGEPLAQPEFTRALLQGCKEMGLHTAIDTSGFLGAKADDALLAATDLVLLDIKSGMADTYKSVTGVVLQPTLDFARRLDAMGKAMWIRFVLVPGLTDAVENVQAVASFVAGLEHAERVEILPFHKMGESKWRELGLDYKLHDTPAPSPELMAWASGIFAKAGVRVG